MPFSIQCAGEGEQWRNTWKHRNKKEENQSTSGISRQRSKEQKNRSNGGLNYQARCMTFGGIKER